MKYNDRSIKNFREVSQSNSTWAVDKNSQPKLKIVIDFSDELRNGLVIDFARVKLARKWYRSSIEWRRGDFDDHPNRFNGDRRGRYNVNSPFRFPPRHCGYHYESNDGELLERTNHDNNFFQIDLKSHLTVLYGRFGKQHNKYKLPVDIKLADLEVKFK